MWPFAPLVPLSYDVIVADPPWRFRTWGEHNQAKSASRHYSLMTLPEIKALPVGQLAQADCLLLLWTTGWAVATGQAQEVIRAWGFSPKSEIVWNKRTKAGKTRMGTGYWARSMHEPILLASIGKPRKFSAFPSAFDGVAREHSRKPDEFYTLVDKHTAGLRRADLFSRESRPTFEGWGNEHGKFNGSQDPDDTRAEVLEDGERDCAGPEAAAQQETG
jgi:N6-adenosine-specific RNA methylase IME4